VSLVVDRGRITRIYSVHNPAKLTGLHSTAALGR
jgi:hypothetical protein